MKTIKTIKILIGINLLLTLGTAGALVLMQGKKKVAYVELSLLYKDFKMTKELEARFTAVSSSRKSFIDSLETQLRVMNGNEKRREEFERVKNLYIVRKQQFEQDNAAMNQQYNDQITKQMNQYLADYGREQDYDFIFGANGSGGLMYANEQAFNVTGDVLAYINKKYAGKVN